MFDGNLVDDLGVVMVHLFKEFLGNGIWFGTQEVHECLGQKVWDKKDIFIGVVFFHSLQFIKSFNRFESHRKFFKQKRLELHILIDF